MRGFLRRIRGIIGTGLTWAAGFVGISVVRFALFGVPWEAFPELATQRAILGFVTGGTFAGILSLTEGRRTLEDLSLRRIALWGAVGGFLITSGLGFFYGLAPWWFFVEISLLSAGFSSGSVAIARRSDTKLIEGEGESVRSLEEETDPERTGF